MGMISDLWNAHDEKAWLDALRQYWSGPYIKPQNRELEERLDKLAPEENKKLNLSEWYNFLKTEYFPFVVKALRQIESLPERQELLAIRRPEDLTENDAVLLIEIMRRKAVELNSLFATDTWTPRKTDMILWVTR